MMRQRPLRLLRMHATEALHSAIRDGLRTLIIARHGCGPLPSVSPSWATPFCRARNVYSLQEALPTAQLLFPAASPRALSHTAGHAALDDGKMQLDPMAPLASYHTLDGGAALVERLERVAVASLMEALEVNIDGEDAAMMMRIRRRRRPELAVVQSGVHVSAMAHLACRALDVPADTVNAQSVGELCGFVLRLSAPVEEGGDGCSVVYADG